MRINVLVFLPGPHRLPFEAVWEGDGVPTPSEVVKAMRDDKLVGVDGSRVTWADAQGVLVMPSEGETTSAVRNETCPKCLRGAIILAPIQTESGRLKWEGSCSRCGHEIMVDERDL